LRTSELIPRLLRLSKRGLATRLAFLHESARKVPIVRRADEAPFSTCLGCASVDGSKCKPGCWVSRLEYAIHMAERGQR
jgi:hypothetical protein